MGKTLTVLIITNDLSVRGQNRFREEVTDLLPRGTKLHYFIPGNAGEGEEQADLSKYDLVILSGKMAAHYGTSAVVDRKYKKK